MKAEAGRAAPPAKIAHGGERRESRPETARERRESRPETARDRRDARWETARDRRDARWDEHRRARREQLIDAALAAVARHGAGVGMEEIAAAAGTSKTVVYRHFADRAALHLAVCTRVAEHLLPALRAAMASSDQPRGKLAAAVDAYLGFLEADPEVYRFVVHTPEGHSVARGQNGHFGPPDGDPIGNLADLVGAQAAGLIGDALTAAGRDPRAAEPWGHGVVGLVRAAADWWLRAGRPMLRGELAAHLTELAWSGLSGVLHTPPEET